MAKRKRYNDNVLCILNDALKPSSSDDPKVQVAFLFCRAYLRCPLEQDPVFSPVRDIYSAYVVFVQSLLKDQHSAVAIPMYQSSAHFCKSFLKCVGNDTGYFSQWGSRKKRDFGMVLDGVHLVSPNTQDLHVLRTKCTKILQNYLQSNVLPHNSTPSPSPSNATTMSIEQATAMSNANATTKNANATVNNHGDGTALCNVTKKDLLERVDAAVVNLSELRREVQKFTEPVKLRGESSSRGTFGIACVVLHMPYSPQCIAFVCYYVYVCHVRTFAYIAMISLMIGLLW